MRWLLVSILFIVFVATLPYAHGFEQQAGSSPAIFLAPSQGHAGVIVTVLGFGFPPNSNVTIYFDDTVVGNSFTDDTGLFYEYIQVPLDVGERVYTVKAVSGTVVASAEFVVVEPMVVVSETSVAPGETIEVICSNLPPYEVYVITIDGVPVTPVLTSSKNGVLYAEIVVPALKTGVHVLEILYNPWYPRWLYYDFVLPVTIYSTEIRAVNGFVTEDMLDEIIAGIENRVTEIENMIEDVRGDVRELTNILNKINITLAMIRDAVDMIETKILVLNKTSTLNKEEIARLNESLDKLKADLVDVVKQIRRVEEETNTSLTELRHIVSALLEKIDELKTMITEIEDKAETRIQKLETATEEEIKRLDEKINELYTRIEEINSRQALASTILVLAVVLASIALILAVLKK